MNRYSTPEAAVATITKWTDIEQVELSKVGKKRLYQIIAQLHEYNAHLRGEMYDKMHLLPSFVSIGNGEYVCPRDQVLDILEATKYNLEDLLRFGIGETE